jgi:hypothetical protein
MRTIHVRSFALAAAAFIAAAGAAVAEENSRLLNSLEVRQLVARAEPGDNARLSVHFAALADQFSAEAKRHTSMSTSFAGNPSRNLGTGMSAHCHQLANLNSQSANTARELSTYHGKLAEGTPAIPPRDAAKLHAGAGAPEPTDKELTAMAAKAGTPAEHKALEEYFLTLAKRYRTEADEHVALAQAYRGTRIAQAAVHHDRLASLARDSAKEATGAADMHKQLANVAR